MGQAHSVNTLRTYHTAWKKWFQFSQIYRFDAFCQDTSPEDLGFRIALFIGMQCSMVGIQANTLQSVYLPGIATSLTVQGYNTGAEFSKVCKSPVIITLLKGYQRPYDKKNPKCLKVKIPFLLEMALSARQMVLQGVIRVHGYQCTPSDVITNQLAGWRIHIAAITGIFFLLRKSEFLETDPKKKSDIVSCMRQDLRFFDEKEEVIPHARIGHVSARRIRLTINFSKTDQSGFGRVLFHERQQGPGVVTCIVTEMERWFRYTHDYCRAREADPIMRCGDIPPLSGSDLAKYMKATCVKIGLSESNVSPHSLRHGGATMLASKGFPRYLIEKMGGWKPGSTALDRYVHVHLTDTTRVEISRAMSRGSSSDGRSVEDVLSEFVKENDGTRDW
jgi:hypothetical protein